MRRSTKYSVGTRGDGRTRWEPGRLLSSFIRFVDNVRRNCWVSFEAQSGSSCDGCGGGGTGFRRGTPLSLRCSMLAGECVVYDGRRCRSRGMGRMGSLRERERAACAGPSLR